MTFFRVTSLKTRLYLLLKTKLQYPWEGPMKLPEKIAIDGPAASGKSTLAEKLAEQIGYLFLDTGIMYRAVTLAAMRKFHSVSNEEAVSHLANDIQIDILPSQCPELRKVDVYIDGDDVCTQIRTPEVEANVSQVASYRGVRLAMTEQQRRIGHRGKVILAGRDIGTVVLPDAEFKVYLEASAEVRAQRRYEEKIARGEKVNYEDVLAAICQRDEIDAKRDIAPMRPAADAKIIHTDSMTIDQVYDRVLSLLEG
jgi:CMP/dCMP kinase